MTALEKYKIIENLIPELTPEDWKMLIYHFDETKGFSIVQDIIKYMAMYKRDVLAKVWPLDTEALDDCVRNNCSGYMNFTQDDMDALLRAVSNSD